MVGPWGLEPQTWPTRSARSNQLCLDQRLNHFGRLPALDFQFPPASLQESFKLFGVSKSPWPPPTRRGAGPVQMFTLRRSKSSVDPM